MAGCLSGMPVTLFLILPRRQGEGNPARRGRMSAAVVHIQPITLIGQAHAVAQGRGFDDFRLALFVAAQHQVHAAVGGYSDDG